MHISKLFLPALVLLSCSSKQKDVPVVEATTAPVTVDTRISDYARKHRDTEHPSESKGTVGKGYLVNGRLMPFAGTNFIYFDTSSYLHSHAFVHEKVRGAVVDAYEKLEKALPGRKFSLMECSKEGGGRIFPHRTHQNGLSIDFMMPMQKNGRPYYGLDSCGQVHYLLDFDDDGRYKKDTSVSIDFNAMALHLQALHLSVRKYGLRISKVILKLELKDDFFKSTEGKKTQGIYFVQQLPALVNALHDDHYHVDFELTN